MLNESTKKLDNLKEISFEKYKHTAKNYCDKYIEYNSRLYYKILNLISKKIQILL